MRTIDHAWQVLYDKKNLHSLQYAVGLLMQEYLNLRENEETDLARLEANLREMLEISDAINIPLDRALCRIELAVIHARQGLFGQSSRRIQQAIEILRGTPPRDEASLQVFAASWWLLGCVQIQLGNQRSKILKNWQIALINYENLRSNPVIDRSGWYAHRLQKMQAEMQAFIKDRGYVSKSTPQEAERPAKKDRTSRLQPALPTLSVFDPALLYSNGVSSLEVYAAIPAGPLAELEDPPEPLATLALDEQQVNFEIEGKIYQVFSLDPGKPAVRLNRSNRYALLKVHGDSMNLANLDDGDYVLIRQQTAAEHMDIVAAQLYQEGENPQATLKRFEQQGRQVHLRAESSNPNNKSYTLDETDLETRLQIIGAAVAVFKPGNIWSSSAD